MSAPDLATTEPIFPRYCCDPEGALRILAKDPLAVDIDTFNQRFFDPSKRSADFGGSSYSIG